MVDQVLSKNFALIGVAGYIAPRHLAAIRETGHHLVAALDKSDSVGILDSSFPEAAFFTEFERFDRHAEKLRRAGDRQRIHYVSICSPNYLHDAHIRFALRIGADAICEKPLVLNPWNLDALEELQAESGRKVHAVLQLRLHPAIAALRETVANAPPGKLFDVDLTYVTSRGNWYQVSWKGDEAKSGGIATNIGVHFFDMLQWVFGGIREQRVHLADPRRMAGYLHLERARVRWFLSVDRSDLPVAAREARQATFRALTIDGREVDFSGGFADLHSAVYREILGGRGFGIDATRPSIRLVSDIRRAPVVAPAAGEGHPCLEACRP